MKKATIVLLCLLGTAILSAQTKQVVKVKFKISQEQYRIFYDNEIGSIESACETQMINFLNEYFGFLNFSKIPGDHIVTIELRNSNMPALSSNSSLAEVGFNVFLTLPDGQITERVYWIFRPIERSFEALPDLKGDFVDEIMESFKLGVRFNQEVMVKNLLSKIELANDYYFIAEKEMFILPMADQEYNINKFSKFLLVSLVPDDLFGAVEYYDTTRVENSIDNIEIAIERYHVPPNYPVGCLATRKLAVDADDHQQNMTDINSVTKKIYILKHLRHTNQAEIEIATP